jgi:hypothetical protein
VDVRYSNAKGVSNDAAGIGFRYCCLLLTASHVRQLRYHPETIGEQMIVTEGFQLSCKSLRSDAELLLSQPHVFGDCRWKIVLGLWFCYNSSFFLQETKSLLTCLNPFINPINSKTGLLLRVKQ